MGASSQPSSSPPPPTESMAVNSDEMRTLIQHRKELDESLAQMEAQIFHEEGSYIKETPCGNVIRGFDAFHDSKLNVEQPKKSRMEVIEERIFSKSSFLFWQRSRDRAAREEAKKREREQAAIANRAMFLGSGGSANGATEASTQPLGYGSFGSSVQGGGSLHGSSSAPSGSHQASGSGSGSHKTAHKKRHPDGHSHGHKKKKKKRASSSASSNSNSYVGGSSQGGGDGGGGGASGSSASINNRYDS